MSFSKQHKAKEEQTNVLLGTLILFIFLVLFSSATYAATEPIRHEPESSEIGWFWGYIQKMLEEEKERLEKQQVSKPLEQKPESELEEQDCTDPEQWTIECGFTHPGNDFEFQEKQRDALLANAAMNSSDPNEVIKFQRYMSWAVDQAVVMANSWEWNRLQNPELNPSLNTPVVGFGIRAAASARKAHQKSMVKEITDQGGFLVWFTRQTCEACRLMKDPLTRLEKNTGIKIYAASLDDGCHGHFECTTGEQVITVASMLNVEFTPDIWLHLPKDDAWFRVSSGVESDIQIIERLELFFGAVRSAAVKGMASSFDQTLPSVDFSAPNSPGKNLLGRGVNNDQDK